MQSLFGFAAPLFVSLFSIMLVGCTPATQVESALTEYTARLERVLDISVESTERARTTYPAQSALKLAIPSTDINLREFYAINNCQLAALVAQRNTALGKAHLPSQRFIYERALLKAFANCAAEINDLQPTLANKLIALEARKQEQFPQVWVNLIQQSDEVYLALTQSTDMIEASKGGVYTRHAQDWSFLLALTDPAYEASGEEDFGARLESTLKRIADTRLPATLWSTQRFIGAGLAELNQQLAQALPRVACNNGKASEQAEILRNVFVLFFVDQIQPIGGVVNQVHYQLAPTFGELNKQPLSTAFSTAITTSMTNDFAFYQQAMSSHVKLWQGFFNRCSLNPSLPVK